MLLGVPVLGALLLGLAPTSQAVGVPTSTAGSVAAAGTTTLVSKAATQVSRRTSLSPAISTDGNMVVYASNDADLAGVAGWGVYAYNRASGATTLLTRRPNGTPVRGSSDSSADVSRDGRYVVFDTTARLTPADTDASDTQVADEDVYLWDSTTGKNRLLTPDGKADSPTISDDGRFIAYSLTVGRRTTVQVLDRLSEETTLVSRELAGRPVDGAYLPQISGDGRFITYASDDSQIAVGDNNGSGDTFLWDRLNGQTTLVSASAAGGAGNGSSFAGSISDDGRFVVFSSYATDLAPGRQDDNSQLDVYLRDLRTNRTTLVSRDPVGTAADDASAGTVSGDGRYVTFSSDDPALTGDFKMTSQLYVWDRTDGTTSLISTSAANPNVSGNRATPYGAALSRDGSVLAFSSSATDLTPDAATGDASNVFVQSRP